VQNDKGKLSRSVYDMKLLNTIPESWAKYPLNCLKYLETNNIIKLTNGLKITVDGNIPQGAGLSSSSALVISIIRACIDYFSLKVSNENIIEWADEIERMVGTNGGLGDQTIITIGDINKIIKYTCLNGIHIDDIVNFPENLRVSLFYTGVKADKGSKLQNIFNYKVSLYDKGLKQLDKDRLDNVTFDDLKLLSDDTKPIITYGLREMRRAENFIYTIKNTDYKTLTNMVNESQQDEVLLYRCSCKEADFIVNIANNIDGVYGAQICGAGMGGTVAVFDNGKINVKEIIENYGFKYITCIS